jgi:glucose/arabinose dehydrogenase
MACGGAGAGAPRTSSGAGLVAIGAGLAGPAGLTATVYSHGTANVAAFAFDDQGRLWFATADYSDRGADGLYLVTGAGSQPKLVVGGLHTPLGLVWYQGALYVASTGQVDAYTGFDGSHFATGDRRVLTLPAGVGESNTLAVSPDGRLVMGISAPCDHCSPASPWSASVVSFLPDGTDLRVFARGIRAPVGLAYFPATGALFVTMNQRDDLGSRTPGDWLAVVKPGQDWRFPACFGQGGADCTGVPTPLAVLDAHAAVSDVAIVTGQLGPAIGDSALVAEWSAGKVQRVPLGHAGSTTTATPAPFLTGVAKPVAVTIGPDGAVYVGDWSSGTIYRVARAAA